MPPSASSEPASKSKPRFFLVDENVAPQVTAFLRGRGNVRDVKEEGWFGLPDEELLSIAQREGRIIVTYDVNFAALKKLQQDHLGIVFLRLRNLRSEAVIAALERFLAEHGQRDLTNTLATIEETRARFRKTRWPQNPSDIAAGI